MISLVALVFAAVAVSSNGHVIPLTYSGLPAGHITTEVKTYTVEPKVYKAVGSTPVHTTSHVAAAIPTHIPTQYVATAQVVHTPTQYIAAAPVVHTPTQYIAAAPFVHTPTQYVATAPVVHTPTQYVATAPVVVPNTVQSQFHSQDELGAYHFGFSGGPSAREEVKDHFGNVKGSYNYIDAEGQIQTTHYTAGKEGFQVAATNLPVAPAAPAFEAPAHPIQVVDTPAVAEAKSAFKAAFDKAVSQTAAAAAPETAVTAARKKRSVVAIHSPVVPNFYSGAFPAQFSGIIPTPLTYSGAVTTNALATRDAQLLRVINNPGHAVSYRVY